MGAKFPSNETSSTTRRTNPILHKSNHTHKSIADSIVCIMKSSAHIHHSTPETPQRILQLSLHNSVEIRFARTSHYSLLSPPSHRLCAVPGLYGASSPHPPGFVARHSDVLNADNCFVTKSLFTAAEMLDDHGCFDSDGMCHMNHR